MPQLSADQASEIGTAILRHKHPPAIASQGAIRGRQETGALPDLRKYGPRHFAGVDFTNSRGLAKQQRRDAWTGAWPISARNLAIAARTA